jgi:hypothetical protein
MQPSKVSDINLSNIESLLNDDDDMLLLSHITKDSINDFNNRNFNPENITGILYLCDHLLIKNTTKFIHMNMEPSEYEYVISDEHKYYLQICTEKYATMTISDMVKYGLFKYLIKARNSGNKWPDNLCDIASEYGHLEILKWL